MRVRDIFDRATACSFIDEYCAERKPATRRASSRIAGCELELKEVGEGDVKLAEIGGKQLGISQAELSELLWPGEQAE